MEWSQEVVTGIGMVVGCRRVMGLGASEVGVGMGGEGEYWEMKDNDSYERMNGREKQRRKEKRTQANVFI